LQTHSGGLEDLWGNHKEVMEDDRKRNETWQHDVVSSLGVRKREQEFARRVEYTTGWTIRYNGAYDPMDYTILSQDRIIGLLELKSAPRQLKQYSIKLKKYRDCVLSAIFLRIPVYIAWKVMDDEPGWYRWWHVLEDGKLRDLEYGWVEARGTVNSNPVVWVPAEQMEKRFFGATDGN